MPGAAGGLKRLAQRSTAEREAKLEQCELCGSPIPAEHRHVLELATRDVKCACTPCSLLFERTEKLRLIPTDVYGADDVELDWEALRLPVDIAFFFRAGEWKAYYPSPMGPTECLLPVSLGLDLEDDVEALLVNRVRGARRQWIVPIDVCYALVGLIRVHWRGFTGGAEVWRELDGFWDGLDRRRRAWPSRATRPM
jgi:hypothetical protein